MQHSKYNTAGAWAKRHYLAGRALMEAMLRPYDLGATQWYVLWQLANNGPTAQRDFLTMLNVEKPTLSGVITALIRKGLVTQTTNPDDQRQKMLKITRSGQKLWNRLPDPIELIVKISFEGIDESDLATTVRVLKTGTERLNQHLTKGKKA